MPVRGDNSLFFTSGLDNTGLASGAQTALTIVRGLATSIGAISPFAILATGAVTAFATIGNSAYQMMAKFELEMAKVKTIANVTEREFSQLQERVFALAKTLGTEPPDALAKGLYDIIGAGFAAGDALKILEISSKAATAGVTTSAVAADGLTTILNAFGLAASDATEIADVMFETVNRGKISFAELSSQIADVAPLAAASGFSFQEIAGAIATLTKQGVPASVAMTQIRSGIVAVGEVLGSAASKSLTLQNAFQEMYERAGGDQDKLTKLAGRIEAVSGILSIAGPNIQGATEDLLAMGEAAGAVDRSFDIIASADKNQWEILGNRIKATTKGIGNSFLDMSSSIAGTLNNILEDTKDLTAEIRGQANEYNILRATLEDVNTPFEKKLEILKELKETYPEYLSSLELDKIENENLEAPLSRVRHLLEQINDEHERRLKLSGMNQQQLEKKQELDTYKALRDEATTEFFQIVEKLREKAAEEGIELNFSMGEDVNDIYNKLQKQLGGGFTMGTLNNARKAISTYSGLISQSNDALDEINARLEESRRQIYDNADAYKTIVAEIQDINELSQLTKYDKYQFPEIKNALAAQRSLLNSFGEIDKITEKSSLKPFLESENALIADYAKKRERLLNTDYKGSGAGGNDEDKKTYADFLNDRKKEYEAYYATIEQLGKESADKIFESLLASGADFNLFLQDQLAKAETLSQKKDIVAVASSSGIDLKREVQTVVSAIESKPIVLGVELDTTSINFLERELEGLRDRLDATQTNSAEGRRLANSLRDEIQAKEEKLQIARDGISEEQKLYENLHLNLSDLRNKGLRDYIEDWNQRLAIAQAAIDKLKQSGQVDTPAGKKLQKEADEAAANIQAARDEIAKNTAETIQKLGAVFGEASDLARKFGDEDLANLLSQLQGVANGVASTMAGILSGNPLDIAKGVLEVLNSAITIEVESDTAKFEAAITKLKAAIADLDYAISRGIGMDKISNRQDAILELKDLQEQADKAIEAEKEAEKRVKLLGITVGKKGKGSGTDHEKIKQIAEEAKEAERRVQELKDELNELFTGTTSSNITDSIIEGFRNGKFAIEDFTQGFEDMMKEAMLNAFQLKYLDDAVKEFYEEFSGAGSDGTFTAAEIENLRAMYATMIEGAQSDIEAINDILNASGIGSIGEQGEGDQREGLSGAITNITEDTANLLAGYMNAVRLDIRQGLGIAITNSQYLSQIAVNTSYNRYLESIDGRMGTIERAIRDAQAQG